MSKIFSILCLSMLIRKAFKFEIRSNGEQIRKIKQFCSCSRFVFNKALAWQNEQYEQDNNHKFNYTKLTSLLSQWKKELVWLKECHSQVLQQSLKDLESAFKNFFQQRADFPTFKKKGVKESFRFPQGKQIRATKYQSNLSLLWAYSKRKSPNTS